MTSNYILMSALPPTTGHADLINFSANQGKTTVIAVTREPEPYQTERIQALRETFTNNPTVTIKNYHLPGLGPETDEHWYQVLRNYGFQPGDNLVGSEHWCQQFARELSGTWLSYDVDRVIRYTRATEVRQAIYKNWEQILPAFQKKINKRVVLFGAESVGKTTMTRLLNAAVPHSRMTPEYARGYLEGNGSQLTPKKMFDIFRGQESIQRVAYNVNPVPPVLFMDTDLFSTVGYWDFWKPGTTPVELVEAAIELKADYYCLLNSNIPFERNELRYGGNKREKDDDYWRGVLEGYGLNIIDIKSTSLEGRCEEVLLKTGILETEQTANHERMDNSTIST